MDNSEARYQLWRELEAALVVFDAPDRYGEIEAKTGLRASQLVKKGDVADQETGRKASRDQWILDSPLALEEELTRHLNWLWEQVRPHKDFIKALAESGVDIWVLGYYCSNIHRSGYTLKPEACDIFSKLGVPFCTRVSIECDAATQVTNLLECGAGFRIMDAADRHDEIETTTGFRPSYSQTKDELRARGRKRYLRDSWLLASPLPDEERLTAHLNWLWTQISPHKEYFKSLRKAGANIDLYCHARSEAHAYSFSIEHGAFEIMRELNLSLDVAVSVKRCGY